MSETVYYTGKLVREGPLEGETVEDAAKRILVSHGFKIDNDYKHSEQLDDDLYKKYVTVGGIIYRADYKDVNIDSDIFEASRNKDGSVDFTVKYYNGGCGFSEAIESAFKELK